MTRSQFILGTALLCVSGTLAFFISFREQESKAAETASTNLPGQVIHSSVRSTRATPLPLSQRKIEKIDPTNYEVSISDIALQEIAEKIESESRQRLQAMTERYQLTANQRREIFPLLVSHHPDYQEGLGVNGYLSANPSGTNLASELYHRLDLAQQEAYQETLLADHDWWGDIIGQLREDLEGALESGEVSIVTVTEPIDTLPDSSEEGRDDGEAIGKTKKLGPDRLFGN